MDQTDVREEWRREQRRDQVKRALIALLRAIVVPHWLTRTEFNAQVDHVLGPAPHEFDAELRRRRRELLTMLRRQGRNTA